MSASRTKSGSDESTASVAQTTPTQIGYGHPEFYFTQTTSEIQKSIGELKASVDAMKGSLGGVERKVDALVAWKNMIFGGAIVLGVVVSSLVFLINKFGPYVTIKAPSPPSAITQTTQPPK